MSTWRRGVRVETMGLGLLVAGNADALTVIVRWGDYGQKEVEGADGKSESFWHRQANERVLGLEDAAFFPRSA